MKTLQHSVKSCACLQGEVRAVEDEKCPKGIPGVQLCDARRGELAVDKRSDKFKFLTRTR